MDAYKAKWTRVALISDASAPPEYALMRIEQKTLAYKGHRVSLLRASD
jgi:hypothetical protein